MPQNGAQKGISIPSLAPRRPSDAPRGGIEGYGDTLRRVFASLPWVSATLRRVAAGLRWGVDTLRWVSVTLPRVAETLFWRGAGQGERPAGLRRGGGRQSRRGAGCSDMAPVGRPAGAGRVGGCLSRKRRAAPKVSLPPLGGAGWAEPSPGGTQTLPGSFLTMRGRRAG